MEKMGLPIFHFFLEINMHQVSGRHTAENIKKQFNVIRECFNIQNKMFKVVADCVANMKKALNCVEESSSIVSEKGEDNIIRVTEM